MKALRTSAAVALAAAVAALPAPAARTTHHAAAYWIVLGSNRDGDSRAYSVRPDGSRLTPLFPRGSTQYPVAISGDGSTIAYDDPLVDAGISVSRADGTGLHALKLVNGTSLALSRNGKLLAFSTFDDPPDIDVVGTDGTGLRTVTSGRDKNELDEELGWSPRGDAFVFTRFGDAENTIVVQPLQGKPRVLARGAGVGEATWSPNGRWIAYWYRYGESKQNGLYLVQPNGGRRHRIVSGEIGSFAWSPDAETLAVTIGYPYDVAIVGVDGRGPTRLHVHGPRTMWDLTWSPDGRLLAFDEALNDTRSDVWVIGPDGRGLRRVTSLGHSNALGWTRLAPVRQPAAPLLPSERVLDATTVATRRPVKSLSADGSRVAFIPQATGADCDHVAVWTPATKSVLRVSPSRPSPCGNDRREGEMADVQLAGTRAAWSWLSSCGNTYCDFVLQSATLAQRSAAAIATDVPDPEESPDFAAHGHGNLLVFNDGSRLIRIGVGRERCSRGDDWAPKPASICSTLRSGAHAAPVESVSGGLIAVREPDAVSVLDAQGRLVRVFPFAPGEVSAARLDGGRLVVQRAGVLEAYDVATGAGELQRPLPTGYDLADVDGGIAVLLKDDTIMLLRLADGRSLTLAPGRGPALAELEPPGLYYSYATADGGGRVVFLPRAEVLRRLGGSS